MTTYLSTHFTLEEATASQTADRLGIDNTPTPVILENIKNTCYGMELVRKELGDKPILISSFYRNPNLNTMVGGSKGSDHQFGYAVDFICPAFGNVDAVVRRLVESAIDFDQVIKEFANSKTGGWVHISFAPRNRKQALVIDSTGTRNYA